ncbi:MAG: hypothetical protein E7362_00520 [Clostridiales bacterium]|nr:hypothetical protein [Clostridiales bacterium]
MKSFIVGIISFFVGIIVAIGAIFLVLKFVPIKSYTDMAGVEAEDVMSDQVYSKSVLDAAFGLSEFTMNDIKIIKDAVLEFANDEEVKKYVTVDEEAFGELTFANLSSGLADCITLKNIDDMYLVEVMPVSGNEDIYAILRDATGVTVNSQIKVSHLKEFNIDNIYIVNILDVAGNEMIYDVLRDGTGKATNEEIKVSDLMDFDVANVKISTFLSSSAVASNKILKAVYGDGTVTIGELSNRINNTPIQEVYKVDCFTTNEADASGISAKYSYNEADGSYTLDASGDYYISAKSGAWFFIFYGTVGGTNIDGDATLYRPTAYTMGGLEEKVDEINDHIENATIKQLIDIGILTNPHGDYSPLIYASTLDQVLRAIS